MSVAVRMGRAIEHRKRKLIWGAETLNAVEGNIPGLAMVRGRETPRCRRTHARPHAFCRDPGRSSYRPESRGRMRKEKLEAYGERYEEVG